MNETGKKLVFIGGDERMLHAADFIRKRGFETALFALGGEPGDPDDVHSADWAVLPVPPTRDGFLNAPMYRGKIELQTVMNEFCGKTIFAPTLPGDIKGEYVDYSVRREFLTGNARLTAQGALGCILQNVKKPLQGMKILLLGWGNVARACHEVLSPLGCDITAAARRKSVISEANWAGRTAVSFEEAWGNTDGFDAVINTVPARVLTRKRLENLRKDCYILELASAPWGADPADIEALGIKYEIAGGLPGKAAPEAAGQIIAGTILNIITEMGVEK